MYGAQKKLLNKFRISKYANLQGRIEDLMRLQRIGFGMNALHNYESSPEPL